MRPAVEVFARDVAAAFPFGGPVLQVGSRTAEGQEHEMEPRAVFAGAPFVGCDIRSGPGTDCVADVHRLCFADATFDAVLAFETLEHVHDPIRAVEELHRVLRPGGVAVVTSVMFFPVHAHPWDFWRFTPEGFERLLAPFESRLVLAHGWELMPEGVFGIGVKGPCERLGPELLPRTVRMCEEWGAGQTVDLGPIRMTVRQLWREALVHGARAARSRLPSVRGSGR